MDDDYVCPLCCEDFDASDRQFFPCKCGYQICMWCWHRIREQESGLCPACRTPYGDDPHEFSAVDVEEVLKANKEKEVAAKNGRHRQRQNIPAPTDGSSSDGETLASLLGSGKKGPMEVPKDRNQLANMRVIRRNLVYAVGLPAGIASDEVLKRPEYFGQYGKIAKLVMNRSQVTGAGDPRRATTSAYCTFAYKEDALACILVLDGFYIDGRPVRASFGTSKYCSAFIKNVRCNNPECTYLHEMGDVEDTFSKQEIQAGYVTSGRDVLARQQQIVEQALGAAAAAGTPRKRIGCGGPSGTGRAANNPILPPPAFDDLMRPSPPPLPPPSAINTRSVSVNSSATFPVMTSTTTAVPPVPQQSSVTRAATTGTVPKPLPLTASAIASSNRKATGPTSAALSAASVVAGSRVANVPAAAHTTLTPLIPLKRTSGKGSAKASDNSTPAITTKLTNVKTGKTKNVVKLSSSGSAALPVQAGPSDDTNSSVPGYSEGPASIGGAVIAAPVAPVVSASRTSEGPSPLASLGGEPLRGLGGEVFTGPLKSSNIAPIIGNGMAISSSSSGNNKDKWSTSLLGGDPLVTQGHSGLWGSSGPAGLASGQNSIGSIGGSVIGGGGFQQGSGSSTLASLLGINLPTGSGSLRETSDLWGTPITQPQAPVAGLHGSLLPSQGVIGPGFSNQNNSGLIGGHPIGGPIAQAPIGGGGNKNDIALLQSLLPGVHITSGNSYGQGNGFGAPGQNHFNPGMQQQNQWYGGLQNGLSGGAVIGAVGQGAAKRDREATGSIW